MTFWSLLKAEPAPNLGSSAAVWGANAFWLFSRTIRTCRGGRIIDNLQIDNLQIDNLQIDNRQIDNQNLQIDNLQIDHQQITFFLLNSKLITNK